MNIADINSEARSLCDADTTSYTAADLLRRVNNSFEQVVGWLINSDGTWQFDDSNYSDFPIGTYTLVNGQAKYSFNDKFLQLEEVQILNKDGVYEIIQPIDQTEYSDITPLEELFKTSGKPVYYEKLTDDTIKLFPAPDNGVSVTLVAGLKIKFKRTASLFTSAEVTTGTKEPGFASPYHIILSYMAALPYCQSYKKDRVALYEKKIMDLKTELINHYSMRSKDERKVATTKFVSFR
jgi:hypothetical protein